MVLSQQIIPRGYKALGTSIIYGLIVPSSLCLLKKRLSNDAQQTATPS